MYVQNASTEPKVQFFLLHLEPENARFDNEAIVLKIGFIPHIKTTKLRNHIRWNYRNRQNNYLYVRYVKKC